MNIRNYTSVVPVNQSIGEIESLLVGFGAKHISKTYGPEGVIDAVIFALPIGEDRSVNVRLPVRADEVKRHFDETGHRYREGQPERTAWKLMREWIHLQLSMIQMGQAQPVEIFLPFVYDARKRQTVFESFQAEGFNALPEGAAR